MKRILLLDQTLNPRSLVVSYAIGLARKEGAGLSVVCLVNPESERTYWIAIQEMLQEEIKEKVERQAQALVAACQQAGVVAEVKVGGGLPTAALRQLTSQQKWDLIIVGETESADIGSAHLNARDIAALSAELTAPVLTAEAIRDRYRPFPKQVVMKLAIFTGATATLYLAFFHTYDWIKHFTLSGTLPAAVAIIVFTPLVAFLGGTAAESLLKALKFEAKH